MHKNIISTSVHASFISKSQLHLIRNIVFYIPIVPVMNSLRYWRFAIKLYNAYVCLMCNILTVNDTLRYNKAF